MPSVTSLFTWVANWQCQVALAEGHHGDSPFLCNLQGSFPQGKKRQLGHHWVIQEMLRLPLTTQFISIGFHLLYEF